MELKTSLAFRYLFPFLICFKVDTYLLLIEVLSRSFFKIFKALLNKPFKSRNNAILIIALVNKFFGINLYVQTISVWLFPISVNKYSPSICFANLFKEEVN